MIEGIGAWLAEKTVEVGAAAKRTVIAAADAVDNAARAKMREKLNDVGESLADTAADASEGYYDVKNGVEYVGGKIVQAKNAVTRSIRNLAKKLGHEPANSVVQPCPYAKAKLMAAATKPADGSLLVPDKDCPASAVAMSDSALPNAGQKIKDAIFNAKKVNLPRQRAPIPRLHQIAEHQTAKMKKVRQLIILTGLTPIRTHTVRR